MSAALILLTLITLSRDEGPRFSAVVEVWKDGVWELSYAHGALQSRRRTRGQDGALHTWPNGTFGINSQNIEQVFWGNSRSPRLVIRVKDRAIVGWNGKAPIVEKNGSTYISHGNRLVPLAGVYAGAQQILDMGKSRNLVVRDSSSTAYSIVYHGRSVPFRALGHESAEFLRWQGGLLATTGEFGGGEERDPGWGDIWVIGPGGAPVKRIVHKRGVEWALVGPATPEGAWLTAGGYDGHWSKFHDYSTLYFLSQQEKLKGVLTLRGDWTFYGFDRTGKWVIGTRWLGWEMAAYDLIAVNIKSRRQTEIKHGVSNCHLFVGA